MRCSTLTRIAVMVSLLTGLTVLIGCFESKYPLSPRDPAAKVDPRFLGTWNLEQLDPESGQVNVSRLVVLNLRGQEYFIDWMADENEHLRAVAHTSDVGGVTFANLLLLSDDPQAAEGYVILRIDLGDGKLKIQNLDGDFFKGQTYDSTDALRKIVAENLENAAMYKGEPFFGSRMDK